MAIKLSNSGITSGSVVKSAEVSQSIDAFTGTIAYDIQQSGSFNQTGSTILSGSVYLPDNTHIGIGTTPSPTAGVKLALKANDSSNDPTILLEVDGSILLEVDGSLPLSALLLAISPASGTA